VFAVGAAAVEISGGVVGAVVGVGVGRRSGGTGEVSEVSWVVGLNRTLAKCAANLLFCCFVI
jgi:hypothetical protein